MTRALTLVLVLLTVAGCSRLGFGQGRDRVDTFDGQIYRGGAKAESRQDRAAFSATVRPVSSSLEGAIQAAEYQGIRHCIRYFGTSDIDWQIGPDTARDALPISGDSLTLTGRCVDEWAGDFRR